MVGLSAFLPQRDRSRAPKPNMRFLRHIIRETDSHNTALLAKEAEESRARLKELGKRERESRREKGRLTPPGSAEWKIARSKSTRSHRQDDSDGERDDHSDRRKRKARKEHKRADTHEEKRSRRHHDRHAQSDDERDTQSYCKGASHDRDRKRRHRDTEDSPKHHTRYREDDRRARKRHPSSSRSTSRSVSPRPRKRHNLSRHRHRPSSRHRDKDSRREDRDQADKRTRMPSQTYSDSDPLESIVGPLPPPPDEPVRSRGRGAHKAKSMAMDARFSSTYDPTTDVHLQSDVEDEWGDALEALKDRQKWKQQGAERLRAAGFTDEQIRRWEKGGEKTEEDVRWAAKGEGREWDQGKVRLADGHIDLRAEWGRLT
ncbi:uncharacterized protein EI97DRAFT_433750 [Westerdykella ornata]|uniref:Pre-mRNA-splicing factor 38B n=1 Tax=Westerdykella ornata TaxID=318751 RepID=A0A6A6JHF3_WESOR|nr:uncharacterized protein EI97DRAFT_433750 [Westerdykella ornata]KAF2275807.1 hypothetical protein EI97DRAFT_433750 [Westerdykella ornata]